MPRFLFRYSEYVPFSSEFIITAENKGEAQTKARRAIDDGVYVRLWKRGFMQPDSRFPVGSRRAELIDEVGTAFKDDFVAVLRIKDE